MAQIVFLGAGSTVFAKNVLGDTIRSPALHDARLALYDIDAKRLNESRRTAGRCRPTKLRRDLPERPRAARTRTGTAR
ncbi:MAG: hypothetical protein FJ225_00795 [Lentisphaerae bacterium]|nr:hypothetical protein [Lentisphaerota bacterium]